MSRAVPGVPVSRAQDRAEAQSLAGTLPPGGPPGRAKLALAMRSYQVALDVFDDAVAHKLGVNRTDLRCLDILDRHQPMTAGSLAKATRLSTGAITFVLDRLEAAGFVRRRRDDGDRRRVLVEMVPSAHETVAGLHLPMIADARRSLSGFTEAQIEVVCRFLELSTAVFERNVPE